MKGFADVVVHAGLDRLNHARLLGSMTPEMRWPGRAAGAEPVGSPHLTAAATIVAKTVFVASITG